MQPTQAIRCETVEGANPDLSGVAVVVLNSFWDDFRLFLVHASIEHGRSSHQTSADGDGERLQFFPGLSAAEVEAVRIAYLTDYHAGFHD